MTCLIWGGLIMASKMKDTKKRNAINQEMTERRKHTMVTFVIFLAGAVFLLTTVLMHFLNAPDFLWTIFLTLSITFITSAIMFIIQISLSVDIPAEVERALGPYSKMKDRGIDNVCGSKDNKDETLKQISDAGKIRCMSRTGRDFIESYGDDIFKLLSMKPELEVEILICSHEAAGSKFFEQVCPESYPCTDIDSFYAQLSRMCYKYKCDFERMPNIVVKKYNFILTGNVLITDNHFKFIPYLPERHSKNSVAIIGHRGRLNGGLYETFDSIFNEIWGSNRVNVVNIDEMTDRFEGESDSAPTHS